MEIGELKKTFMQVIQVLVNEGLIGAQFHVSCRFEKTHMLFIRNMSPLLLTDDDILSVKFGEEESLGYLAAAIYRARSDVNAIVHAHPPMCIAVSTLEEEFRPIHHYGAVFYQGVPLYDYPGQVNTREKAAEIAQTLGMRNALFIRGHGTVTVARHLQEACLLTIYLEEAAKMFYWARAMGTPKYFPADLSEEIAKQVFKERSNQKAWNHYAAKLKYI